VEGITDPFAGRDWKLKLTRRLQKDGAGGVWTVLALCSLLIPIGRILWCSQRMSAGCTQ